MYQYKFRKGDVVVSKHPIPTTRKGKCIRSGLKGVVAENRSTYPYIEWKEDVGGHERLGGLPGHCWAVSQDLLEKVNMTLENK